MASKSSAKPTRERLLEAALILYSQNGYSATSVRDITAYCGLRESALYNHFKNKDTLLEEILNLFKNFLRSTRLSEVILQQYVSLMDPKSVIMQLAIAAGKSADEKMGHAFRVVFLEMFRDERVKEFYLNEMVQESERYYARMFRMMIDRGKIRECNPELVAREFYSVIMFYSIEYNLAFMSNKDVSGIIKKIIEHIEFILYPLENKQTNDRRDYD